MESTKRTSMIVLASVAAAAAGISAVVAIVKWRQRNLTGELVGPDLRDVQDVLSDCYRKIDEIESRLPSASPSTSTLRGGNTMPIGLSSRAISNGNPA